MTKLLGLLALAAMTVALTPKTALAEEGVPIKASFTVAFTRTQNTSSAIPCAPLGTTALAYAVDANGAGYSSLGALSFELHKTLTPGTTAAPGSMQGCATLKSPNGDALYATYAGTIAGPNGAGTLTFTGGTGRFLGATGSAKFTGVFVGIYPTLTTLGVGGGLISPVIPYIQGMAFYLVEGTVDLEREREKD